ncbi:dihydroxyacetone kinase subunit DhaL [Actinomadura harenae]|uniref:Dihydroxyacetone kinase subunit L n=1 Tax=Actinomadura harenae TaxID=2483351 RepID=A0A3M2M8I2_9ACTN|nr:dihydroxyacetone kinase subunit DhaL [Actinomadura harenae]RMI45153.1 dihydroxyacetone kinase subunit L [Actinomadura harenae]
MSGLTTADAFTAGAFTAAEAAAWIRRAAELVSADADRLTRLDAAIGDGDHGLNLDRGFAAAVEALPGGVPPGRVLIAAGRAIVSKTGGASGPLYGTALRRAGKALGDTEEASAAQLGEALTAAVTGIRELGGAQPGDKTMLDALTPAAEAFAASAEQGVPAAARAALEAAEQGAEATVPLVARKGRASYLGERSAGHLDPGAASSVLLLRALADVTATSLSAPGPTET